MLTTINSIQANKGIKLNKKFIALISVMLMVFAACASEGEQGAQGPAGEAGPAGPAGEDRFHPGASEGEEGH